MSQNDYVIANQSAPDFRADLNNALQALASLSSGTTAPTTTYANMLWYDSANNILKMRSEADDAWISIGTLNQSTNEFEVAGLTTLSEAIWETGTDTTESLVSPAKVKAADVAFRNANDLGWGQTWQSSSRTAGTAYQNTTGKPIFVTIASFTNSRVEVSNDGSSWFSLNSVGDDAGESGIGFVVQDGGYYRLIGSVRTWKEFR